MWSSKALCCVVKPLCAGQMRTATSIVTNSRIGVLGAPFEKGQKHAGVADGPSTVRKTDFITTLIERGLDVIDYGDLREELSGNQQYSTGPEGEKDFVRVLEYNKKLAMAVADVRRDGRICVTLGGDHSIAIGTIAGHAATLLPHQKLSVLWIDAHADINTGATSRSSNMHGMSAGFHLKEMQHSCLECSFPVSQLDLDHLAYIGLRDVDIGETKILDRLKVTAYHMSDVDRLGMAECVARCFDHLKPSHDQPLHVSFDIDAIDPVVAPATGTPVMGGLTVREGCVALEAARETGHLHALDLVEVNPSLSNARGINNTALAARTLLFAALSGH
ncbi:Arginase [Trinorchestia longiramus]|nr:Arginase [Trinorchestia longiramus]